MQVCTSLQTENHASTPTTQFFTRRMAFLPPNQQLQSTEGYYTSTYNKYMAVGKYCAVVIIVISQSIQCLQCFDAVGWAAGRASGL